ncbi:MAG: biopolymer transporter ExbB [Proteobacteria bacterium]|nr:biopolymer transporter ExbB [Rhodobacterales bacterium LSUCC0374]MBF9040003.1 biopolymer transporter ExbB [Rhodobacterales bacterium LSUCC0387]MDA0900753.1 biopolymer transporter ExbB [Pseudomonadota bacterium]
MSGSNRSGAQSSFTRPTRQIFLMMIICGLVAAGGAVVYPMVWPVFLSNPYLNGTIGVVFLVGVMACFWQVLQLFSSVRWIEGAAQQGLTDQRRPELLAPLAAALQGRGARMQLSTMTTRSVLDSVGARMEESRDITRYLANLLIFLGLLGTFFGLATTVPAVVDTIRGLQPSADEDGLAVFSRLMTGLESQLGGMGTAFASSLLGLAGSLVVGLLELFAGHGQNRFYREMEEWLSFITRMSFSSSDGDGGGVDRAAVATVLDHMVDQIDSLQAMFAQSNARQAELEARMVEMTRAVVALAERMTPQSQEIAARQAHAQEQLVERLELLGHLGGFDDEARARIRSIDIQLVQIFEQMAARANQSSGGDGEVRALRREMAALTAAIRRVTEADENGQGQA